MMKPLATTMVSKLVQLLVVVYLIVWNGSIIIQTEAVEAEAASKISFSLVNTDTDTLIRSLTSSSSTSVVNTIDIRVEKSNLSIVGIVGTTPTQTTRVSFYIDNVFVRDELTAPYCISGDINNGDYAPYDELKENKICTTRNITSIAYNPFNTIVATGSVLVKVIDQRCSTVQPPSAKPPTAKPPVVQGPMKPVASPPIKLSPPVPVPVPVKVPTPTTTKPTVSTDVVSYKASTNGTINGELRTWHKITLGFYGPPNTSETSIPNPFLYYRFIVTFVHASTQTTMSVPGYYATDGNSANTGSTSGNVWLVHFSPPYAGVWKWTTSFVFGTNIAINMNVKDGTPSTYIHNKKGSFTVLPTNKTKSNDLRYHGRLKYVKNHYLQFAGSKEYFLKAGVDSPENFLAYTDFDNTPNDGNRRKSWSSHVQDYTSVANSPTWKNGKGKGIIGAINYLSNMGMNVFSFLTMNINGDDKNVFPYISTNDYTRMDVSKLAQWEVLFEHADTIGMYLHFKTQETENDQLFDKNGELGIERKLYYRELIARFGHHLALNWNLGEENTNTVQQQKEFANYFKALDPYDHPIVVHTYPWDKEKVYTPLLGFTNLTGLSLQSFPENVVQETRKWITESTKSKHKWVVSIDEQGSANAGVVPDSTDYYHDTIRKNVLYGNLMNNGGGVEYYFGYQYPNSDLTCQDFRSRENMYILSKHAIDFFHTYIPFWNMSIATSILGTGKDDNPNSCLTVPDQSIIVVYLPNGGTETIKLTTTSSSSTTTPTLYTIDWYDPEIGGTLKKGSIQTISLVRGGSSSSKVSIGNPPYRDKKRKGILFPPAQDWVVLIRKK